MSLVGPTTGSELRSVIRIKRKRLWVKRIVILEGGLMFYYKSSRDTQPRGILPISSYAIVDQGMHKGEYLIELHSPNKHPFCLAFPTLNEGMTWLEAIKAIKSEAKSSKSGGNSQYDIATQRLAWKENTLKEMKVEVLPAILAQKIRPIIEKKYVLVETKSSVSVFEDIEDRALGSTSEPVSVLLGVSELLSVLLFALFGDSVYLRTMLFLSLSLFLYRKNRPRAQVNLREIPFKCTGRIEKNVAEVLNCLQDTATRPLWDPFCSEATENEAILITYSGFSQQNVKQKVTRSCYKEKSQYYMIERESGNLKYIFVLEEEEKHPMVTTKVTVYGTKTEPFSLQAANPNLLPCFCTYLHLSELELAENRPEIEPISADEEESEVSPAGNLQIPESIEGQSRYEQEASEALSAFKQLLEDATGWEPISTGSASVQGYRRQAPGGLYIIRGEGVMPQSVSEIVAYLKDLSRKGEYDSMFESGHVIERFSDDLEVVYQRYKKQFPASGRDLCLVQRKYPQDSGEVDSVAISTTHPNCPVNKDLVRAHLYIGGFHLTPLGPSSTKVVYITHADLGGRLPTMIVNKVQNSQALVVDGIRRSLASR